MTTHLPPAHPAMFWPMHWQLPEGVHAVCTTRQGGNSQAPYDSLNLGDHVRDAPLAVAQNRALLRAQLGGVEPVFLSQVHGVAVVPLHASTPQGTQADACYTLQPQVACTIMVADCLPVLFSDVQGRVVGAAHAGWRGLAAGVLERTAQTMCAQAGASVQQLRVWLGPCIGPAVFEVGPEVYQAFTSPYAAGATRAHACFMPHPTHANKWLADLAGLARLRLQDLGVRAISGNDSTQAWCTVSQPSSFFSYRRDGVTGRFAACIWRS